MHQNKGDEIRIGCLTLVPSRGPTRGWKCYVTPAFSGAHKRAEVLHNPLILGGPQQRGQNQKSKLTLGVTMMPLVSQSMGL